MFAGFMTGAWVVASVVAVVAGVVGFFVVLRGSAFAAHAIPNGAFAGAAGAALLGWNTLLGLGGCAVLAALGIGSLGRRERHDVATALALVVLLALGAALLSRTTDYAPQLFSLLFGEVLGISANQVAPVAGIGVACLVAVAGLWRPLLLSSALPEAAEARGVRGDRMDVAFLLVLAAATTLTVPVVGTLLTFTLMVGPPAAARAVASRPAAAVTLSVALALVTVWFAIAASYLTDWPIGFYVGALSAAVYGGGRAWTAAARRRQARRRVLALP